MSKKFPYGYDVETYINKAIEKMKYLYPWVKREMFDNRYEYSIKKIDNKYQYGYTYHYDDKDSFSVLDQTADEFIDYIIWQQEDNVQRYNDIKDVFEVPGQYGKSVHGWYLENYEFRKHILGGYSVFCQAGDRVTGGSRTFFIPEDYFDGTYEEFLNKYIELVPPSFGFTKEELLEAPGLKEFLGF